CRIDLSLFSRACFSLVTPPGLTAPFPYTTLFRSTGRARRRPARSVREHPRGGTRRGPERHPQEGALGLDHHHPRRADEAASGVQDRKSTRLNSSHVKNSYADSCVKEKRSQLRSDN